MKLFVIINLVLVFSQFAVAQNQIVAKLGVFFGGEFAPSYVELSKNGVLTKSVYGNMSSLQLSKINTHRLNNLAAKIAQANLVKQSHQPTCLMAPLPFRDLFVEDEKGDLKVVSTPRGDCTVGEEARPASPTSLEEAAQLRGALEALADQF